MPHSYQRSLESLKQLIRIKEYSACVKEAGTLLEVLLRDLYTELLQKVSGKKKEEVLRVEKEIGEGRPVNAFTLGELVGLFLRCKLLGDASQTFGRKFRYMTPDNLHLLIELRNKCTHQGYVAEVDETELVRSLLVNIVKEVEGLSPPESRGGHTRLLLAVKYGLPIATLICLFLIVWTYSTPHIDPLRVAQSVVTVAVKDGQGTVVNSRPGFIIKENGVIVTHLDVVRPYLLQKKSGQNNTLSVRLHNGAFFPVRSEDIQLDTNLGLAWLNVEGNGLPAMMMGDSDKVKSGDRLLLFAKGDATDEEVIRGDVVSWAMEKGLKLMHVRVPLSSIGEGAPAVNTKGRTVGLVTRIQKEVNSCSILPSNSFRDFKPRTGEKSADFYYAQGIFARNRRDDDKALKF